MIEIEKYGFFFLCELPASLNILFDLCSEIKCNRNKVFNAISLQSVDDYYLAVIAMATSPRIFFNRLGKTTTTIATYFH